MSEKFREVVTSSVVGELFEKNNNWMALAFVNL